MSGASDRPGDAVVGIRFLATMFAFVLTACSAAIGPGRAELENKLRVDLPSIWKLTSFKVTAEENAGTQTQPDVRSRFVATLVLARDLYKHQEHLLGRPVLVKVKAAGDMEVELHGIARSHQSGGSWDVKFDFENARSTEAPGRPLSEYNDYVLAGSPEESVLRDEATKQAEVERKAQEEAQKAKAEAERHAQEKMKALNDAVGAIFRPGAKLLSRWTDSRSNRSGAFAFVVAKHDPLTRTFSGGFKYDDGDSAEVSGSYDGQKVSIARNDRKCRYELVATGEVPTLRGNYDGPALGGCRGGTVEMGLQ